MSSDILHKEESYKITGAILNFLSHKTFVLEIKALKSLLEAHPAQAISYLLTTKLKLGLLINTGDSPEIEFERPLNC